MYIKEVSIDEIEMPGRCMSALVVKEFVESGFKVCEVDCRGVSAKGVACKLRNYIYYHKMDDELRVIRRNGKVYLAYK